MTTITNQEFLDKIFPPYEERKASHELVFTCSTASDPTEAKYPYVREPHPDRNNFFCVSTLDWTPGGETPRRSPANFKGLYVLVVDDVGTKIPEVKPTTVLGVPTYIIETSPKNYQWGYVFEKPVTNRCVAQGLLDAMCRTFSGDLAGLNRLVRLPVGINGKKAYGDPSPRTELRSWSGMRITESAAATLLGATPVEVKTEAVKAFLPASEDPVYEQLAVRGLITGDTKEPGVYLITCPWVVEHTGGRDDGTVYIAPAGFKCHHGHCSERTFKDLRKYLGFSAKSVDRIMEAAAIKVFVGEISAPLGPIVERGRAPGAEGLLDHATVARFHTGGRLMTAAEGEVDFARKWIFKDLVTANGMWLLAGQGGLGKSRLALVVAMSAATGLPFGEFRPAHGAGIKTLFMTQEDDDSEKFHRYRTQLAFLQGRNPAWADPEILARLEKNLFIPELDPTAGLTKGTAEELLAYQREHGAFGLAIWDPLILFWQGDDEAGLNSAQGARDTLNFLTGITRVPAKEQGTQYSVCLVHHLNKSGTVFGSVMVENLVRTVFKLETDEAASRTDEMRGRLIVDKSNGISLRGREAGIKLHKPHAVVEMLGSFITLTPEDRVVKALMAGEVKWDQKLSDLKADLIDVMLELGDTKTERASVINRILKDWTREEEDLVPGLLERVGTAAKLRFRPVTI